MAYIDGFVIPVPTAGRQDYVDSVQRAAPILREFGALRVVECWGDDVSHGERTDFYRAVEAGDDETVGFSWIEWPDKQTRDAGMKRMMEDPRMRDAPMPFDGKRMIFGGFVPIVDA